MRMVDQQMLKETGLKGEMNLAATRYLSAPKALGLAPTVE